MITTSRRQKDVWSIYVPTVGWIHRSLFPAQLFQICCHSSEINLLTCGKNSEAWSFIGVTESERAAFAALSAFTLPLIPVWLGIHHKSIFLPLLERNVYSLINLWTRSTSIWKLLMASKLDFESEKIIKFCSFERRTTSIARTRAYSSALKILMLFGSLTDLQLCLWTNKKDKQTIEQLRKNNCVVFDKLKLHYIVMSVNV